MPTTNNPETIKKAQASSNRHEEGSVADGTAELENNRSYEREDAIELGRETAADNLKKEKAESTIYEGATREETLEDARETAKINHNAEQERLEEGEGDFLKNNTSKAAKVATAKSQLDPAGVDPISDAEIARSATDASMETGNRTAVSNEEAADRAHTLPAEMSDEEVEAAEADSRPTLEPEEDAAHPEEEGPKKDQPKKK